MVARFSLPGAGFAIVKDGRLVLARGYGFADVAAQRPVEPTTRFLLASVSKSITAATVMKLVEDGRLQLAARAFDVLDDIRPLDPETVDPRTAQITVVDLLYHAGGWDRQTSGDPLTFGDRVARALDVRQPIGPRELVRYMLSQPLDFTPGTKTVYSNYGYMLLGLIVERVTGEPYAAYVRENTLAPMGIHGIVEGAGRREYVPGEARRYGPSGEPDPIGGLPPVHFASGAWIASPVEMARFMAVIGGQRPPAFLEPQTFARMLEPPPAPIPLRPNGSHFGMGWDSVLRGPEGVLYEKDGGVLGTTTWVEHRPNGAAWVLLINSSNRADGPELHATFLREIRRAIDDTSVWPERDLFADYP
ncbi:MAG: serine hydrolase domain-containing protein [Thermodesulfobacteriota bacterium]